MRFDATRKGFAGIGALCREAVENGAEDQSAVVYLDGRHALNIRSIFRAALTSVTEQPTVRHVAWSPHPHAVVGPRVRALLMAREIDRRLRAEYGR